MTKKPLDSKSKPKKQARGLGRGLSALMSDVSPAVTQDAGGLETKSETLGSAESPKKRQPSKTDTPAQKPTLSKPGVSAASFIAINKLVRNPAQPRRYFDPVKLEDLTRSISEKGVIQPLLARPIRALRAGVAVENYQIVAGERRWQAALKAGLDQLPVMIMDLSDQEVLEIGVVENVQRANLNPIEEAQAYKSLVTEFNRRQEDVAQAVGKSRSHVANMMRLLTLPDRAQTLLAEGRLTAGHARAVISAPDPAALAEMIVQKDLSVRDAEAMVRKLKKGEPLRPSVKTKTADIRDIEKRLSDEIGLRVDLKHKNPNGQMVIHYKTADQLEALIKRLPKGFK